MQKNLEYLFIRYHRNVLRGAKDRVYFKMILDGLLALFTLGVKTFLFPFIFKKFCRRIFRMVPGGFKRRLHA